MTDFGPTQHLANSPDGSNYRQAEAPADTVAESDDDQDDQEEATDLDLLDLDASLDLDSLEILESKIAF